MCLEDAGKWDDCDLEPLFEFVPSHRPLARFCAAARSGDSFATGPC
jgi:hypothetical protein